MAKNEAALVELREQLREIGRELEHVPLVVVLNKRDTPTALPVEVAMTMLGLDGVPTHVGYSSHHGGSRRSWADTPREGHRPLLYVARGSALLRSDGATSKRAKPPASTSRWRGCRAPDRLCARFGAPNPMRSTVTRRESSG